MPMGMLCRVHLVAAETKKPPEGGLDKQGYTPRENIISTCQRP